jgi:glycosyltransferase involved in cell wall biosynthesis
MREARTYGDDLLMRPLRVLIGLLPIVARARFHTWRARRRGPSAGDPRRVLFLASFWPGNAGYEYRIGRWAEILDHAGFEVDIDQVFDHEQFWSWVDANDPSLYIEPARRRLRRILASGEYGTVIVVREILLYNDYGHRFLEGLLLAMHPNAILDFDDDLGAAKGEPRQIGWFGRVLGEDPAKFSDSLRMYRKVIAGSGYLKQLALERASQLQPDDVVVMPTCLDYEDEQPKAYGSRFGPLVFGWIGGTGNLEELDVIVPALERIARDMPLRLLVISGRPYSAGSLDVEFVPWDMGTHLDHLRQIDVGLMPLSDTAVSRGKCGFKLLQYMGLGIVGVATALTVNTEIVDDGVNGFLVGPNSDWECGLRRVIAAERSFPEIGRAARETVLSRYSFLAHRDRYIDFVRGAAPAAGPASGRVAREASRTSRGDG